MNIPDMITIRLICCLFFLTACADLPNRVTEEQIKIQNQIDNIVSTTLFDRELDAHASYNIRNDGMVVIKFDDNVTKTVYTEVVKSLRANKYITMLRAEQAGVEVCGLP